MPLMSRNGTHPWGPMWESLAEELRGGSVPQARGMVLLGVPWDPCSVGLVWHLLKVTPAAGQSPGSPREFPDGQEWVTASWRIRHLRKISWKIRHHHFSDGTFSALSPFSFR